MEGEFATVVGMMATVPAPNVLILGNLQSPEMRPVREWLSTWPDPAQQRIVQELRSARAIRDEGDWFPDLVIVCETWTEQYSGVEVHALLTLFPLARLVCCYGRWCLSEGRTREVWPLSVRVPAADAGRRLQREWLDLCDARSAPASRLPLTASRGELYEFLTQGELTPPAVPIRAEVDSPDPWLRQMWEQVLQQAGYAVESSAAETPAATKSASSSPPKAGLILFDLDPWPVRQTALIRCRQQHPTARMAGLVAFPELPPQQGWGDLPLVPLLDKLTPLVSAVNQLR